MRTDAMPIFEKNGRRVAFIHIPKAAGSSVETMFRADGWSTSLYKEAYDGYTVSEQHRTYASVKETVGDLDEIDSFVITRDPLSRLISEWHYQTEKVKSSKLNFDDFVRHVECSLKLHKNYWDNHWRSQVDFLDENIDAVIKMESMNRELPDFLRNKGIMEDPRIPHVNRHEKKSVDGGLHISAESKDRILRMYGRDYVVLGYEPVFPETG